MKNFTIFNSKILVFLMLVLGCIELGKSFEYIMLYAGAILPLYYAYCWVLHSIVDPFEEEITVNEYGLKLVCSFLPFTYVIAFKSVLSMAIVLLISQIVFVLLLGIIFKKYNKLY